MAERNAIQRPELIWKVTDAKKMAIFQDNFFDLIIDKSTIDCLLCGDKAYLNSALTIKECYRILKPGGIMLSVSYAAPEMREFHFKRPYIEDLIDLQTFKIVKMKVNNQEYYNYIYSMQKLKDK
mmetsp:Transcript_12859/g.8968  ORF Transcript_12859/g.8968 Transcript_12859/m.8968 type:complete len:124 (+) Transcript_12859:301-672(+)